MKHFLKSILLFVLINLGIFACVLLTIHIAIVYKHWKTDPDVFIIPQNQKYDFVILGTSHGQMLTRFSNQQMVEKILGVHFFNLSQPNAGPVMEKVYLQLFLAKGNSTPTVVYFIDPHVLYALRDNEYYNVLPIYGEFDPQFIYFSLQNHISSTPLRDYFQTYLSLKWFIKNPRPNIPNHIKYVPNKGIDTARVIELYPEGKKQIAFDGYSHVLEQLILLTEKKHMKLLFIIPPTRLKTYPGMDQIKIILEHYKQKYGIDYYDYSNAITDNSLYSNIDHLNSDGVRIFTQKYLLHISQLTNIEE